MGLAADGFSTCAILQLLDELPDHESFHQVDVLMEELSDLTPRGCRSCLSAAEAFADRHRHAWLKHIERAAIDLGSGKRMLVKEGRYDPTYQIVPKELEEAP